MGMGAPQDFAVEHASHLEIDAVLGPSGNLVRTVMADWPRTNDFVFRI